VENLVIDPTFWNGKKVFLTGHTGFKGSWLSLWLSCLGARVCGYSLNPPTDPNLFNVASVAVDLECEFVADIRDRERLADTLRDFSPDVVIHMAAQALVLESYEFPIETYETNVMGTANILEAIRTTENVRAVIIVTSDKCYENSGQGTKFNETDPMGGFDPYSSSKGCAELVTAAFRNSFFNPDLYSEHKVAIASTRAGNVIGGGDWNANRLVPDIMNALVVGEPVEIRNRSHIRPWQHVLEPLSGYLLLVEHMWSNGAAHAEAWNFGPLDENAQPVHILADRLVELWGGNTNWVDKSSKKTPHEASFLKLDCAKAEARLGWAPRWNLSITLENIVAWYKAYKSQANMKDVVISQIEAYQNFSPNQNHC
jgi:CDP-glucose 4,6-dehydratase